ncbi:transcriptional regulator [Saccharothrix violaceirubra]|uniref:Phenylacetic acid degradation operon negative regulatory protein n=1 Tax=Saccharothrix violaceirubra TaxID=413306 RepID=A0A7W7T1K5_9PSEU|nr:PaaX family transcriptional regulator C-terminal domain-containing protein [Saccharothrix violaceirubra]MBB4964889.1 phenylacetic acid degradation operon negative regulatory protein [Saccharothrix violaceirubra]
MDVEVPTRTVVEALVRPDGTVDAGELYEVANALGMSDQQVRLCLKRLVAEGRFTQEGRGRRAVLRAASREAGLDVEFVRFMYRQDAGEEEWDGVWHLVAFAVPESRRRERDALRDAIVRFGGAALHGGLYASPHAWEDLVEGEASAWDVDSCVTFLTSTDLRVGGERDPVALAARLWPLDAIADRHRLLAAVAAHRLRLLRSGDLDRAGLLRVAVELAAEFTRAVEPDPLLPPELLPSPWVGTRARAAVARCWSALAERADDLPALFVAYRGIGEKDR